MDILFIDNQRGWAVGYDGQLISTTDGGTNWNEQSVSDYALNCIEFISPTHGFIGGDLCTVLETTNGGLTWQARTDFSSCDIYGIDFVDANHGWIIGNLYGGWTARMYYTRDGAQTWHLVNLQNNFYCYAVEFADTMNGYVFGDNEKMLVTHDGGQHWTEHGIECDSWFRGVHMTAGGKGCAVGGRGSIMLTADAWETTELVREGTVDWFYDVDFPSSLTGWVVGRTTDLDNTIWKTTDGGHTWEQHVLLRGNGLSTVSAVNTQVIWIAGYSGEIYRSTNGGQTWNNLSQNDEDRYRDSYFIDDQTGWIVGDNVIMQTTNGGQTWDRLTSDDFMNLLSVNFVDENTGWIVNGSHALLKTTDGGANWLNSELDNIDFVPYDVFFQDAHTGWLVGYNMYNGNGAALYTTDGGSTWTERCHSSEMGFRSVRFIDHLRGTIVGSGGVMSTADGGENWEFEHGLTTETLRSVTMVGDEAWAVGYYGVILHRSGTVDVDMDPAPVVPRQFALSAYPNPFNPATTIRVELEQPQHFELSVYDVTGRLVRRLAESALPQGVYNFNFAADELPSGIYFANLQGSVQSATTRLILIK